jgi:beta-hydroxylase
MSTLGMVLLVMALVLGGLGWTALYVKRRLEAIPEKEKKAFLKKKVNGVFTWFEDHDLLPRTPAFNHDYLRDYPALKTLEDGYDVVREECLALLEIKESLTDMSVMGGSYTKAGIHTAKWKTFLFKSGEFVEENCELCPRTAALLRGLPDVYTAFFSVLDPHQRVVPHWGYYKGFVRYHLGVIIPNDNEDRACYLRVNADPYENELRDPSLASKGETYYWKNGEGIVFDDNYLHEAENGSDEVRVVLWIDLRRKMPFYIQLFNMLCLAVAHRDRSVMKIRDRRSSQRSAVDRRGQHESGADRTVWPHRRHHLQEAARFGPSGPRIRHQE